MKKTKSSTRRRLQRFVRPPFKHGQIIQNQTTGDILAVMSATKYGVTCVPAITVSVFIHPPGYQNFKAV
jgi:hypothetical protein